MYGKGIFEIEAGKRGFKFGTYAGSITSKEVGLKVQEIFATMFDFQKDDKGAFVSMTENANTINYLLHYFYGGAVAYAKANKIEPPTVDQVGDWIDEIGLDRAITIYSESVAGPNVASPEKEPGKENITG